MCINKITQDPENDRPRHGDVQCEQHQAKLRKLYLLLKKTATTVILHTFG